ncbi:hypothetical protein EAV90_32915 [Bradyrhizobium vignae]|nr:hypothetical protein EAV90_32915 [Bradyrhizobium vignae]
MICFRCRAARTDAAFLLASRGRGDQDFRGTSSEPATTEGGYLSNILGANLTSVLAGFEEAR